MIAFNIKAFINNNDLLNKIRHTYAENKNNHM
jgi:hypothetical protein